MILVLKKSKAESRILDQKHEASSSELNGAGKISWRALHPFLSSQVFSNLREQSTPQDAFFNSTTLCLCLYVLTSKILLLSSILV